MIMMIHGLCVIEIFSSILACIVLTVITIVLFPVFADLYFKRGGRMHVRRNDQEGKDARSYTFT
jgi:hypothetical protein